MTMVRTVLGVNVCALFVCVPTSCAAARAGKCPYFVVKMLYSVLSLFLHMVTVNSSKTNFPEMH